MHERRPRVCFLIGGREGGGGARLTLQLIVGIDRDKYDIAVVACEQGPFAVQINQAGFECHDLGTGWPPQMRRVQGAASRHRLSGYVRFPMWTLRTARRLGQYVRSNGIEIIHTNYHHFHFIAALARMTTPTKCIWHWHAPVRHRRAPSGASGRLQASPAPPDRRWSALRKSAWFIRLATGNTVWSIANSRTTEENVRAIVGGRITLIYNGVPMTPLPADRVKLRSLLGIPDKTKIVGLVASLNPLKGHHSFIEAAGRVCPRHDDVHFVYIGGQMAAKQEEYETSLRAKRTQLGLEGHLHFLGHRADAAVLVADFDIATVCTLPPGEGFGLVIVEAMARSVPVISTNEGAATEIITDGQTGVLIPAADAVALADAIEELLDDEQRRRTIGDAGRTVCQRNFDLKKTVLEVQDVYDKILAHRPSVRPRLTR